MQIDDTRVVPLSLLAQVGLTVGLAGIVAASAGAVAGYSLLLGGAAAFVPNAFLAARLLAPRAGESARRLMQSAWLGELGKLLLTALAFGAIFALVRPLAPLAVFGGFIAAQMALFGALLLGGGAGFKELTTKS